MIPRTPCELAWRLPRDEPWTPDREDRANDDSYAGFRGTWPIIRVSGKLARAIVATEAEIITAVDAVTATEDEFETVLSAIESDDIDAIPEEVKARSGFEGVARHIGEPGSEGLDLGVAGLVHALASVGVYPAASCRGHRHWSATPVIRLGARLWRAERLVDVARRNRCSLHDDDDALLTIRAESVEDMMRMAVDVLDHHKELNAPREPGRRRKRDPSTQLRLDL